MGYLQELRNLVGTRPLIINGSCIVVLDSGDRLLLQRRNDNGHWGLPGGTMEPGESYEDTARRVLVEETGLQSRRLKLLELYSGRDFHFRSPNGEEVFLTFASYLCTDYDGQLKNGDDEVQKAGFFKLDRLPEPLHLQDWRVIQKMVRNMPQ